MAEYIFRDMVKKRGIADDFHIESAAHSSEEIGNPVYPPARRELAKHGISCNDKRARQMRRDDYDKWDYIIGMEKLNLGYMLRILGDDPEGKVSLLMDFTDTPEDIADPWYTGDFEGVYEQIVRGCEGLLKTLGY
jgi:protein-tyrosine phosphatase